MSVLNAQCAVWVFSLAHLKERAPNTLVCVDSLQWDALTLQVIVHALQDQGASVARYAGLYFVWAHPQSSLNAVVQRLPRKVLEQLPSKSKAQISDVFKLWMRGVMALKT